MKRTNSRKISEIAGNTSAVKYPPISPPPLEVTSRAKRRLLSSLSAGGAVLGVSALVPATWVKPVVNSVILPTHAQTSPPTQPPTPPEISGSTPTSVVITYPVPGTEQPNLFVRIDWEAPSNPPSAVQGYYVRWSPNRASFDTIVVRNGNDGGSLRNASDRVHQVNINVLNSGQQYFGLVRALYAGDGNGDDTVASSPNTSAIVASAVFTG